MQKKGKIKKEKWGKPKLIILVRGKPEERILVICKLSGPEPYLDVTFSAGGCDYSGNGCSYCTDYAAS